MTINCPHCENRVIARLGEHCPKCFEQIGNAQDEVGDQAVGDVSSEKRASIKPWLARKSIGGIIIGVGLALWGFFGGAYQNRGAGYIASDNELVWVGVALTVVFGLMYLVCRPCKRAGSHSGK